MKIYIILGNEYYRGFEDSRLFLFGQTDLPHCQYLWHRFPDMVTVE